MNILILNWRDIKNPKSGGAEILTHELAKRWVSMGHYVTLFSSEFSGCKKQEILDGIKIIRAGNPDARYLFSSVHFLAYTYYKKKFKENFDVVIDEVHGLPFFTPWYVKEKKVVLICEVAGKLWIEMFGLVGLVGRLIEKFYLKSYKDLQFLTISESTKEELVKEGVKEKNITVLPMGVTVPSNLKKYKKEPTPTLIFVGRLSKPKGIEDAIEAISNITHSTSLRLRGSDSRSAGEISNIKLWVVGRGEEKYVNFLKNLTRKLNIEDSVKFFDFVSEEKKFELMGRAHILLTPSIKEGWGLTVPEAAFVGTPAIVYDSAGLRDILKDSQFKIITKLNTPAELAEEVIKLFQKKDFFKKLTKEKLDMREFDWDRTAKIALKVLESV